MTRMRFLTGTGIVLLLIGGAMQAYHPKLESPPVTAEIQASDEVRQILRQRCYSCHSNETKLPWYDNLAPAYWIVRSDVLEAREHLNFSTIGAKPEAVQRGVLFESVNTVQLGSMPLPRYLAVHRDAGVTPDELATLRHYLETPPAQTAAPAPSTAAETQFQHWIASNGKPTGTHPDMQVQPEWNGVPFLPEYKNWKPVSSTERWDNHTMRQILGNDIALKAIADGKIDNWPDGTVFAKVAWLQQPDGKGGITTGAFQQVELMIKDSKTYASTEGWGWGRWRGDDLKPYGKDATLQNECISCHEPVAHSDHVYTMPIGGAQ